MIMTHAGLPWGWTLAVCIFMVANSAHLLIALDGGPGVGRLSRRDAPLRRAVIDRLLRRRWPLLALKICLAAVFLLVITVGLFGTPLAKHNLATVLTWNLWWSGLILAVLFTGSAWCAICPWDNIATWLVRRGSWARRGVGGSLDLRVPKTLRNLWPACAMLIALSWLELGWGVTTDPYATGLLALFMIVAATASLALFERKAFCRYFCPVGRTIGAYSQLAMVELRPLNERVCQRCTTLACFHGDKQTPPCPTQLVMGRLKQSTYCTACGHCVRSCPDHNVTWRLRPPTLELADDARAHWDEAWFLLVLLALTAVHGFSMTPWWERLMVGIAGLLGDSGRLLWSFSVAMLIGMVVPLALYALSIALMRIAARRRVRYRRLFADFACIALPLAFAYHLAHNLTHLARESDGFLDVLANPFGIDALPLGMAALHQRHLHALLPQDVMFALQAVLLAGGFWLALKLIRHRYHRVPVLTQHGRVGALPAVLFAAAVTALNTALMMQPMTMRF